MRFSAAALLALLAARGHAAIAFVTDELVLGVYADPQAQAQRLATLHSGATLESLETQGEYTRVRLADGITGWVKSAYLTTREPATVRVKQLETELDQSRATTPELADAAQRRELEHLRQDLSAMRAELEAANRPSGVPERHLWPSISAVFGALVVGFGLGYAALARRVRQKFGGIKVY